MNIPVFLSCPKPYLNRQEKFLNDVENSLDVHDLCPLTLGRSEYDMSAPLVAIRRMMAGCCGLIAIAFRRTQIIKAFDRPDSDRADPVVNRAEEWLTSPYCQIEPAMAFQIGLPMLVWREKGVAAEGVLDRGAIGISMPEFDLDSPPNLKDLQWRKPLRQWVDQVRTVYDNRGNPPKLW